MKQRSSSAAAPTLSFFFALFVFFALALGRASAATLFFAPATGSFSAGQTFAVKVNVSSADQAMNVASGDIIFPAKNLQVVSVSKANSIITLWAQDPTFTNIAGSEDVHFEGVALNPGFTGASGNVVTVTFRAVAAGGADVSFSSGSVLANDGSGTNILTSLGTAHYVISASAAGVSGSAATAAAPSAGVAATPSNPNLPPLPTIVSNTHPSEDAWYNAKTLGLFWNLPAGVDGMSYALSRASDFALPSKLQSASSSVSYDLSGFQAGSLYFFLKFHNATGWGPVARRRVNIDFVPPQAFSVTQVASTDPTDPQPVFRWSTSDVGSGIDKYLVKIGDGDWFDAATIELPDGSGYRLPIQGPVQDVPLLVAAYDRAGNSFTASTSFSINSIPAPTITKYSNSINSPHQLLNVQGTSTPGVNIQIHLKKSNSTTVLSFSTKANQQGSWAISEPVDVGAGLWAITAQAADARGAMSDATPDFPLTVGNWFAQLIMFFLDWGAIILAGIFMITVIALVVYSIKHRLSLWRVKMNRELLGVRKELRNDLKRIHAELEANQHADGRIDLRPSAFAKKQELIEKEIQHIEADLQKEIKAIDKLQDE